MIFNWKKIKVKKKEQEKRTEKLREKRRKSQNCKVSKSDEIESSNLFIRLKRFRRGIGSIEIVEKFKREKKFEK